MAVFSAAASYIFHLVASVSNVKLTCLPGTHPPVVSPKILSFVLYSLSCTPWLSMSGTLCSVIKHGLPFWSADGQEMNDHVILYIQPQNCAVTEP